MAKCEPMEMESLLPFRANEKEGIIFIDEIDTNGEIRKGRHREPGGQDKPLDSGKCKENENKFECARPGFRYQGRVFSFNNDRIVIVVGKRSSTGPVKDKKDKVDEDEVWVGVKTST